MSLSRSLTRPLSRSLTRTLTEGSSFFTPDPDGAAYIAAVLSAGATVSAGQIAAVDTFYKSAKADSYYTSLKRLYLPIWGVAAANAIDMIGLTSGTFNGSVTHGAGFVQGNGSTGYFNAGVAGAIGLSIGNAMIFNLALNDAQCLQGGYGASPFPAWVMGDNGTTIIGYTGNNNLNSITVTTTGGGVQLFTETASNARALYRRLTAGFSTLGSSTSINTADISNVGMFFAGAISAAGSPFAYPNAQNGAYGVGLGFNAEKATSFTLSIKNLWETCTGLTLP